VMEGLQSQRWVLGGESSGHIINLRQHTTGDGILAALQIMTGLVRKNVGIRELLKGMEKLPQVLVNVRFQPGTDPLNADNVKSAVQEVENALADKGRVLLRKSGTEPLIRVMVEGRDASVVRAYAQQIAQEVEAVGTE